MRCSTAASSPIANESLEALEPILEHFPRG
jgi:hypothetical protein